MDIGVFHSLEQKQLLSQSQIQGLEILAMDNVELNKFMQNEYLENPVLEYQMKEETRGRPDELQYWYDKDSSFQRKGDERREKAVDKGQDVFSCIHDQIDQKNYDQKDMEIVDFLIESLDQDGFFHDDIHEIAEILHTGYEKVERCLADLRILEPYGIFSEDLAHCLIRQVEVSGLEDDTLKRIIQNHLEKLGEGRISDVSREMNLSTLQVRKYMALIGSLNPRPLAGYCREDIAYVIPDIILSYEDRQWQILLNDRWIGDYRLNDYYMRIMDETEDPQLKEYFKGKLERARLLLSGIEQRRETILRITGSILKRQERYFSGKGHLYPMSMAEVAAELNVHTSTISRGIRGKYLQSPLGTILMRKLFTSSVGSENHSKESRNADSVKAVLKELVSRENREKPYSDQKLKELLEKQEIVVSRRVVAKYREEMGIKGSFERKRESGEILL